MPRQARLTETRHKRRLILEKQRAISKRMDILQRHSQKLFPRISVVANRRLVHGQKPQRLAVEDPHGQRLAFEQNSIAFLALPDLFFCSLFASNVPDHPRDSLPPSILL